MLMKPINASPCSETVTTKNITASYELFNGQSANYAQTIISKVSDGSQVLSNTYNSTFKKMNSSFNNLNVGEYMWESFYLKKPEVSKANEITILSPINEEGDFRVVNDSGYLFTSSITYNKDNSYYTPRIEYFSSDNRDRFFNKITFDTIAINNMLESDGYSFEELEGYPIIACGNSFYNQVNDIGLGNLIVELYIGNTFITRTKFLASVYVKNYNCPWYIIDDKDFWNKIDELGESAYMDSDFDIRDENRTNNACDMIKITKVNWYDKTKMTLPDISGFVSHSSNYYYIKNVTTSDYYVAVSTMPKFTDVTDNQTLNMYNKEDVEYNITPTYYFKVKDKPNISISSNNLISTDDGNEINDTTATFTISSSISINYSYFYIYVLNPDTFLWELVHRMKGTNAFVFDGFVYGRTYKVCAVCTDIDGDDWSSEDVKFKVNIDFSTIILPTVFNNRKTTIDIFLSDILKLYNTADLSIYKTEAGNEKIKKRMHRVYTGETKKDGYERFNKLSDYNIKNDVSYQYYIRVSYIGKEDIADSGVDFYFIKKNPTTNFNGTSILGITSNIITNQFDLAYHFNSDLSEFSNEIKREYLETFDKYPKELQGHQNYISGSCSGLLGSEKNGVYIESKIIKDEWTKFINDDSTKFYRGIDGKTLVIGIETSKIKSYYYSNCGIVNEVYFTYREIADCSEYSIFTTEKVGV